MTGTRTGTLTRRISHWNGSVKSHFTKHWMDKEGCCLYLEWLRSCYPDEKMGLVWDATTCHFSDQATVEDNPAVCTKPGDRERSPCSAHSKLRRADRDQVPVFPPLTTLMAGNSEAELQYM
jgi:hypothetical protein